MTTATATHTPGPWRVTGDCGSIRNREWDEIACAYSQTPGRGSDDWQHYNSLLIAAAPDLLSALRGMVDMFERHIDGLPGPDDAAARWDSARDAIAKATGNA